MANILQLSLLDFSSAGCKANRRAAVESCPQSRIARQKLRSFTGFAPARAPMESLLPALLRTRATRSLSPRLRADRREHRSRPTLDARRRTASVRESDDMEVTTSRFGTLQAPPSDILLFEQGLIGLRTLPPLGRAGRRPESRAGLAAVHRRPRRGPRRRQPPPVRARLPTARRPAGPGAAGTGQRRATRRSWSSSAGTPRGCALNLRAPLVINVEGRRGRQVVAKDPLPVG